jgi:hypothetical protein
MDRATSQNLEALRHHSIAHVEVTGETVELGIPESEGWRLVISAAVDEQASPTLRARWEPGLRRPHDNALRRMIARARRSRASADYSGGGLR